MKFKQRKVIPGGRALRKSRLRKKRRKYTTERCFHQVDILSRMFDLKIGLVEIVYGSRRMGG